MSVLNHARARLLVCCVAATAVLGGLAFAPAAGAASLVTGSTYLALGDSLTYGYHAKQFSEELSAKASPKLKTTKKASSTTSAPHSKSCSPNCRSRTSAAPGRRPKRSSTAQALRTRGPTAPAVRPASPFPFAFLHRPYTHNSQMEEAEAILKENPNVSPITLDMGANDILQFLEHTCGFPSTYTCTETQVVTELAQDRGPRQLDRSKNSTRSRRGRRSCWSASTTPTRLCCPRRAQTRARPSSTCSWHPTPRKSPGRCSPTR